MNTRSNKFEQTWKEWWMSEEREFKRRGRSKAGKCVLVQGVVEKGDCV